MIAGQLHLFGKNGLFYKEDLYGSSASFESRELKLLETTEHLEPSFEQPETRYYFTPVEVNGATQYVTGFFQDAAQLAEGYQVTVWLLVESINEPNTNCDE